MFQTKLNVFWAFVSNRLDLMFLYFLVLFLTFIVVMPDTKSLLQNIFLLKDFYLVFLYKYSI